MIELPHEPVFVSPYRDVPGGVDYLGLRAVNLDLMNQFLPGINNVTREVRPFSMACWIVWSFAKQVSEQGIQEVRLSDFRVFREKAELLFNWSHALHKDDAGMFGNAQAKPEEGDTVPLSFEEWKRNVSWFDAVAYGPSLKTDNGMGFLKQVHAGIFAVTKQGEELAKHLDRNLMQTEGYAVLASLNEHFADQDIADSLYAAWKRGDASEGERAVFREAFYDVNEVAKNNRTGKRSAAITLIHATLADAEGGLTDSQVRRALVIREPTSLPEKPMEQLRSARANWQVLQVRQAHRLAFETLFGWLEWQVLVNGLKTSGQLVEALMSAMSSQNPTMSGAKDLEMATSTFQFSPAANQKLVEQIDKYSDLDFFSHMEQLLLANRDDRDEAASIAVRLLLLVAILTKDLKQDKRAVGYIDQGGTFRLSLGFWSSFVLENQQIPLADFLLIAIENFLLSQHFGFAAARYSEGKLRLRVTIEDTGLVSLLPDADKVWSPVVTQDRLASALSLMANSGMISRHRDDGEIQYST